MSKVFKAFISTNGGMDIQVYTELQLLTIIDNISGVDPILGVISKLTEKFITTLEVGEELETGNANIVRMKNKHE